MTLVLAGPREHLDILRNEGGGHRWQRVPPTEKFNRVHTSTVTVAVLDDNARGDPRYQQRDRGDFRIEWFSGTGNGGQNRNKIMASCRLFHLPTGLKQEAQCRTRGQSYQEARDRLYKLLDARSDSHQASAVASLRRDQVGSGQRGDKVRTYALQRDVVHDHRSDRRAPVRRILAGELELLA